MADVRVDALEARGARVRLAVIGPIHAVETARARVAPGGAPVDFREQTCTPIGRAQHAGLGLHRVEAAADGERRRRKERRRDANGLCAVGVADRDAGA